MFIVMCCCMMGSVDWIWVSCYSGYFAALAVIWWNDALAPFKVWQANITDKESDVWPKNVTFGTILRLAIPPLPPNITKNTK